MISHPNFKSPNLSDVHTAAHSLSMVFFRIGDFAIGTNTSNPLI